MAPLVWLITGCSSGFGRDIALAALARGDKVIATARSVAKISSLKEVGASVLALDVTADVPTINATIQEAHSINSRLDVLVNNAGYLLYGAVEELRAEDTQAIFNTNLFGALNVTRACLPYMRSQKSGVIGMISSFGSWSASAGLSNYCATKWAMSAYSIGLNAELAEFGIQVCSIEPGYFKSKVLSSGSIQGPSKRMTEYDGTAARETMNVLDAADQNQEGDTAKGAKVIVDVLTKSGVAEKMGKIPRRLPLGGDAVRLIKELGSGYLNEVDEWAEIGSACDHM